MLQKLRLNKLSVAGIVVLLVLLVLIRVFQEQLFYDPLVEFYRREARVLPAYDSVRLFCGLLFRYGLNMMLSLWVLYLLFRDRQLLGVTALLYAVLFFLLAGAFFAVINSEDPNLLVLFYIRRFIIQPLFLFLFVPALYYQKNVK